MRSATERDLEDCKELCIQIRGIERTSVLLHAIREGSASVVEREGKISGYATAIGFDGHAVGETNEDLKALIGAAEEISGLPGFLLPARNGGLFRWCLENGLRVVQPMTLMVKGTYREPSGAFLPSIYY